MPRYDSIDVMRAWALAVMVPCHFVLFFSPYQAPYEFLYTFVSDFLGGIAGPVFVFLVGTSLAVSLPNRPDQPKIFDRTGEKILRRAGAVFLLGILLDISIEGSLYEWGVLPFISASLIALCVLRHLPLRVLVILGTFIFFLTPWLRDAVGYVNYWGPDVAANEFATYSPALLMDPFSEYLYADDFSLYHAVVGFFVTGYFPIFPWLLFPIFGFVAGRVLFGTEGRLSPRWLAGIGALLVSSGAALALWAHWFGTANFESGFVTTLFFFPLTPSWALIQLGVCLVSLVSLHCWLDLKPREGMVLETSRFISKYSLTLYWAHYVVAYWPARLLEIWSPVDRQYLGNLVNTPTAILLGILALQSFYFVFAAWEKQGGKYSAGWLVRKMSAPLAEEEPRLTPQ